MGITIHYQGKLNRPDLAKEFCEELEDISKAMEWKYSEITDEPDSKPFPLKGVVISPHEKSEPLVFTFDPEGNLRNAFMMRFADEEPELTWYNHTKTQFAPVDVHMAIVKLLKYLQQKYMDNLEVMDEGSYWDTGDEQLLKQKIDFLHAKMGELAGLLNTIEIEKEDTAETLANKMEKLIKEKMQGTINRIKRKK
ncbi:hypothetical protein [Mariniphaga sp.]|uniref:hypothetical protein n=1 Tax=Mariniphaga sp. TaxID=1954475 RepID=UPI0035671364